ncbi:MAG: M48 family metallopeptidase [Alphaproteobacteria bacterium]|nr:M48 family metallopeptidase [Alphaproteobacteria bacterium]
MTKSAYDHIQSNNIRTWVLVGLFPLSLLMLFSLILYILLLIGQGEVIDYQLVNATALYYIEKFALWVGIIGLGWMAIVWNIGGDMMLSFAGAVELDNTSKEHKKIYNLVENTAMAAGLPTPRVFIVNDESLNAFATGKDPQHAAVALTSGIIKRLNSLELQGVIAHELAHIGNRDVRLNMMIISGVSIFGFLADLLFRMHFTNNSRDNEKNQLGIVILAAAITFMVFNFLIAPLLRLAVSRCREYAADSTGALITRNPQALADALKKISQDARVEALDSAKEMAAACIYTPLKVDAFSLTSTHPPVEERIKRLEQMAGNSSITKGE